MNLLLTTLLCVYAARDVIADDQEIQDGGQTSPSRVARSPKYMRFGRSLGDGDNEDILADSPADVSLFDEDDDIETNKRESMFPRVGGKRQGYPRFGRGFPRFGKRQGYPRFGRAGYPRFGKRDNADFLRFGRDLIGDGYSEDDLSVKRDAPRIRFGKRPNARIRFGKRANARIRFGKRDPATPMIRFGKRQPAPRIYYGKRNLHYGKRGEETENTAVVVDELERVARSLAEEPSSDETLSRR